MNNFLVVSHERSGTHLTINMINSSGYVDLPWFNVKNNNFKEINEFLRNNKNKLIKSHHQYSDLFDMELLGNYNIVYVMRNPLDVLTSLFFYFSKAKSNDFPQNLTNINQFVKMKPSNYGFDYKYSIVKSTNFIDRWFKHIKSWENYAGDNLLIIKYEDIIENYDKVKNSFYQKFNYNISNVKPDIKKSFSILPRKGVIGDYKNHFNEEIINLVLSKEEYRHYY